MESLKTRLLERGLKKLLMSTKQGKRLGKKIKRIDRKNVLQTCRNNLRGKLRKRLVWKRSKTKHVKGKGMNEPKRDYQNVRSRVSLPRFS